MYLKLKFSILFLLLSNLTQAQKATWDKTLPTKELKVQEIKNQIIDKEEKLYQLIESLHYNSPIYDWESYITFDSKEKLQLHINRYQKIIKKISHNPNLFSICNEINNLNHKINAKKEDACKRLNKDLSMAKKNVRNAKTRLKELSGIEEKENNDVNSHLKEMDLLDEEIRNESEKSKTISNKLDALNGNNKISSIDDFLATTNNTPTDFLSEQENNNIDDFLSDSREDSSDDFLSEANNSTDFKITTKNNLQGVVNTKGDILIPFKNWEILEYKQGIAKVSIVVKEKNFGTKESPYLYLSTIYKIGFVDASGNLINEFTLKSKRIKRRSYKVTGLYLLHDDYKRDKRKEEYEKNQKRLKEKQALNRAKEWELNQIYQ
ncbi:hypothetical protein JM80_0393 [Cellulophaga sp. RHA_52]|uniref:hypothetical protein n=1 Tax=Cellulophaga sp. RHA_52 TaxID=1250036 RepID=UPI00119A26F3|nr:hypothetical protein [Cellulophaga sp. RHA_52]TVZ07913.1 hypothetical protein JM80_0393 [Cellulophaga sp. RHA_52]